MNSRPANNSFATLKAASLWFFRGLKRGDWLWLWLAVVIASASVTLVEQLAQTVHKSMLAKAAESLSADLVLRSSRPIEARWREQAEQQGLAVAQSLSLTTMAMANDEFQMVLLKGLSANAPLRGHLHTKNNTKITQLQADQVFADPQLQTLLALDNPPSLTLGRETFKVADWLTRQDVFQSTLSQFAPQVIMPLERITALGLIGPGSRVTYELAFAGEAAQLAAWQRLLEQQDIAHWQILSARAPTPDLEKALATAWLFLDLSALATVLIAGLAILIASRFYLQRWMASMALMRASGASDKQLTTLFAIQLMWLALLGSALGGVLGLGLFQLITPWLADYFNPLIWPNFAQAFALGLIAGTLALWTFAWPAFRQATRVSPLQVFRQAALARYNPLRALLFSLLLLIGLMSVLLNHSVVVWALPALLLSAGGFYLLALALLYAIARLQPLSRGWLRLALAGLAREPGLVKLQFIALGLVVFLLILMTFVRQDLVENWQASLPQTTPNTFMVNIQPDQLTTVKQHLARAQIETELVPMVRGRLVAVNQQAVRPSEQDAQRARRLLQREANNALLEQPPSYNRILAELAPSQRLPLPSVSVEAEIAELFGLTLGDVLTFDIIGQRVDYQITSLREVEWQSFRLNFFFILQPQAQLNLPFSYISNFHNPLSREDSAALQRDLAQSAPGVLWIDARDMIDQVQRIMQQAALAVSLLYLFTLVSSLIVIFTATQASQLARLRSWLLLRTLGAKQADIVKLGLTEFVLIGLLAGLFAAILAQSASLLVSYFWLDSAPRLNLQLWLASIGTSVLLLLAIGWLTQRTPLRQPPKQLLQQLQADA